VVKIAKEEGVAELWNGASSSLILVELNFILNLKWIF